ncbi:hypothetical protein [Persicobacter psychrovividus]|uniref:AsmA-like C-terminal domain-containing protein n=1 Tax=Persicobacter psychrovividus TaxID=387638 RepID=A0ABN6LDQ7_9BACT|nr:hypothetical protein PEPS_32790 [Persicobacter psychrovividus]
MKKYLTHGAGLFLLILLLISLASYLIGHMLESQIKEQLKQITIAKDADNYKIDLASFDIHWSEVMADASGISIQPKFSSDKSQLFGNIDRVQVKIGWGFWRAFFGEVHLENMQFDKPELTFYHRNQAQTNTPERINVIAQLQENVSSVGLQNFSIKDGKITIIDVDKKDSTLFFSTMLNLRFEGLSTTLDQNKLKVHCDSVGFQYRHFQLLLQKANYLLTAKNIELNSEGTNFQLDSLQLSSTISVQERSRLLGHQTDQLNVHVAHATGKYLDFDAFLSSSLLHLGLMEIDSAHLTLKRDKNFPENKRTKVSPLKALARSEFQFILDTLKVAHSKIDYLEKDPKSDHYGNVDLDAVNMTLYGLANPAQTASLKGEFSTKFYQIAPLQMSFSMPYQPEQLLMTADIKVGGFPIKIFDAFCSPALGVEFPKGEVIASTIHLELGRNIGRGNMGLYYKDLKIKLVNPNTESQNFGKKAGSWLANHLLLKNHNYRKKEHRNYPLYYERQFNKSIIAYTVKTIFSGLAPTFTGIDITKHKRKKAHKKPSKHKREAHQQHQK